MISIARNKNILLALQRNGMLTFSQCFITSSKCLADPKNIPRGKTPIGKLDQTQEEKPSDAPDPYAPFPDGKNPTTGEVGGPRGPEPTRYGDWERKGRVTDF
ncbi:hypothetical protein JTE90_018516 [Oedothorax gibbosus]|uniref:Succinate dehydrogenase assembly factor 4, mitochondrial n=1 Tax=Oedothorax gibbosus TaxID=931172 RepID=A0AAV6UNA3_9ARAC|nr:hypothetical protein JTE90_018516 [Oedothorax gibbosus]